MRCRTMKHALSLFRGKDTAVMRRFFYAAF